MVVLKVVKWDLVLNIVVWLNAMRFQIPGITNSYQVLDISVIPQCRITKR